MIYYIAAFRLNLKLMVSVNLSLNAIAEENAKNAPEGLLRC